MSLWTPLAMLEVESSVQASQVHVPQGEHAPAMMSMVMHLMSCHYARVVLVITNNYKHSQHVECP